MRRPRRNHSPAFKARVALEALKGEKAVGARCPDDPAELTGDGRCDLVVMQTARTQPVEALAKAHLGFPSRGGRRQLSWPGP